MYEVEGYVPAGESRFRTGTVGHGGAALTRDKIIEITTNWEVPLGDGERLTLPDPEAFPELSLTARHASTSAGVSPNIPIRPGLRTTSIKVHDIKDRPILPREHYYFLVDGRAEVKGEECVREP